MKARRDQSTLLVALLLLILLPAVGADRPVLRPARRAEFAGRIVVVPPVGIESSRLRAGELRLLAELADHELILAPPAVSASPRLLQDWLTVNAGLETDGLLLDWGSVAGAGGQFFDLLREQRPRLPIYAMVDTSTPAPAVSHALSQWRKGRLDLLVWSSDRTSTPEMEPEVWPEIDLATGRRRLLRAERSEMLPLLLTRHIAGRLGEAPHIYPVYSSSGQGALRRSISRQIETLGATEFVASQGEPRPPDLLLFVHMPGATPTERDQLLGGLEQAIGRRTRVAVVDLHPAGGLFAALREKRLLDRLAGFAADSQLVAVGATTARALSQAVTAMAGLHALRDDLDRLFRLERAQVRLLFSRYLSDQIFPHEVLPALPAAKTGVDEAHRTEILARLQAPATLLFNEQFRRNIHATRMTNGERAQFQIALLQQLRLRLLTDPVAPAVEILPAIHLAWLGNLSQAATTWELTGDEVDRRLIDRWLRFGWEGFATGAERVRVAIRVTATAKGPGASPAEGYRIESRRTRATRRIEIHAGTVAGAGHALSRLAQLGAAGELERDLDLTESPAAAERGVVDDHGGAWSLRERLDLLEFLGRQRINRYHLVLPEPNPLFSPAILEQLRRAAESQSIRLTVGQAPPPDAAPLEASCGDDDRERLIPTLPAAADSRLFRLPPAAPYLLWPRLAAAAAAAWRGTPYHPEPSAETLPAGEESTVPISLRLLLGQLPGRLVDGCAITTAPFQSALSEFLRLPVGRRPLALLKGELRLQLSRPPKPAPPGR